MRKKLDNEDKEQLKYLRGLVKVMLFTHVVLCTPVMARSLYTMFHLSNEDVNMFIDEAGLMKMIDFLPLAYYKRRRTWIYGDSKQNKPVVPEGEKMDNLESVIKKIDVFVNTSVSAWFKDLDITRSFRDVCRRLPQEHASKMVDFFYKDNPVPFVEIVKKNTITLKDDPNVSFMPKSLMLYPHMSNHEKERETTRINEAVKYMQQKPGHFVVVTTHNYLKDALLEVALRKATKRETRKEVKKEAPDKLSERYRDEGMIPEIHTSYLAQGDTFKNTFFMLPGSPSRFVDDRMCLVALSRHDTSFKTVNVDTKRMFNFRVIWYYAKVGVLSIRGAYSSYRKKRRGHYKHQNWVKLHLTWNKARLKQSVLEGVHDKLLAVSSYERGSAMEQLWLIENKEFIPDIDRFYNGESILGVKEPNYKWLMFHAVREAVSCYRRSNSKKRYLRWDQEWEYESSNQNLFIEIDDLPV